MTERHTRIPGLITRSEAIEQGFVIDSHASGRPIAYKGRRFDPTVTQDVFTPLEERLIAAAEKLLYALPILTWPETEELSALITKARTGS